jgi:opacity protein-like surface antigen
MNMKKSALCAMLPVLFAGAANAAPLDFYVGATGGIGREAYFENGNTNRESAVSYGAMFGIDVPFIRAELEYNRLDTKGFDTNAAMANVYFKMLPAMIIPYVGIGAGAHFGGDVKDINISAKSSWAAQGMLGVTFEVPATSLKIDAEARAIYMAEILQDIDELHYDARVKVRYVF